FPHSLGPYLPFRCTRMNVVSVPPKRTFIRLVVVFDNLPFGMDIEAELKVRSDVRSLGRDIP
ncbi:MAG: hypothetical protein KDJ29_14855, partial [Hyphomicrobiales bacterium]|nr:hypothetical protein [Hyphomicrobiales bacterium]